LWFVDNDKVGRISVSGTITEFEPLATPSYPGETATAYAIALGSDGNVWFTLTGSSGTGFLGVIHSTGEVTNYAFSGANNVQSRSLVSGPDGKLWFTQNTYGAENGGTLLYRATVKGEVDSVTLPDHATPHIVAAGPDGNLWVVVDSVTVQSGGQSANVIDRVSTNQTVVEVPLPSRIAMTSLTAGTDENLWFGTSTGIGRISVGGDVATFTIPGHPTTGVNQVCTGPDGNIWFTADAIIGATDPVGNFSTFVSPASAYGITAGPDGDIWFTEPAVGKIARLMIR